MSLITKPHRPKFACCVVFLSPLCALYETHLCEEAAFECTTDSSLNHFWQWINEDLLTLGTLRYSYVHFRGSTGSAKNDAPNTHRGPSLYFVSSRQFSWIRSVHPLSHQSINQIFGNGSTTTRTHRSWDLSSHMLHLRPLMFLHFFTEVSARSL